MTILVVIALALVTITLFYVALRSRRKHRVSQGIQPLDLNAFHTLTDRDDEAFLRERLPRGEFFRLKRLRIRVTWKYVRRISDNSAVVLRLAGTTRLDPDPQVAETAAQLADLATNIRIQCLIAFAKLTAEFVLPSMQLTPAMLEPKYESLRASLMHLRSLHPQAPLAAAI